MRSIQSDGALVQQCLEQIERDIVDNVLHAGEKLRVEGLRDRFSVGQSPIREALSRLVATGLVEARQNRGFYVARISESSIRDTYRTFDQIENLALAQAIALGDHVWEAGIVAALHQLSLVELTNSSADSGLWAQRNAAFHGALIAGCDSPLLLRVRTDIYKHFDRYCRLGFLFIQDTLNANHHDHEMLARAVLARDAEAARKLMTEHIYGSLERIIDTLKARKIL